MDEELDRGLKNSDPDSDISKYREQQRIRKLFKMVDKKSFKDFKPTTVDDLVKGLSRQALLNKTYQFIKDDQDLYINTDQGQMILGVRSSFKLNTFKMVATKDIRLIVSSLGTTQLRVLLTYLIKRNQLAFRLVGVVTLPKLKMF